MKTHRRKSGFTLVEILIVVIILGILAAIVIPQFTEASSDARESSLTSNLQTMRSQLELYKVQHNDDYPSGVDPDAPDAAATLVLRLEGETDVDHAVLAGNEFGPYLHQFPTNPLNGLATVRYDVLPIAAGTDAAGWVFDPHTGAICADSPLTAVDGTLYIDL